MVFYDKIIDCQLKSFYEAQFLSYCKIFFFYKFIYLISYSAYVKLGQGLWTSGKSATSGQLVSRVYLFMED